MITSMHAKPFAQPNSSLESVVTTALSAEAQQTFVRNSQPAKSAATVLIGVAVAGVLALVGVTLFALAIAFPIAVSVAGNYSAYITASDLAMAKQFAAMWPLFAVASVAAFAASLATIVKIIQRVDPAPKA